MDKKRGFTLIELMVVIAIIGILTSIAMPRFLRVTESAKASQVQGNLANLRTSIQMYNIKTGRYPDFNNWTKDDLREIEDNAHRFTEFYSKNKIAQTPIFINGFGTQVAKSNSISYGKYHEKGEARGFNGEGGWLYITEEGTGEGRLTGDIFANVVSDEDIKDPFNQGVDWREF